MRYSAEDELKYKFVYTERNDGVTYQDRTSNTTNRALLAGAFEELATNPTELKRIREISFSKGKRDAARLKTLREEAEKTANRIDTYDRLLLRLESA